MRIKNIMKVKLSIGDKIFNVINYTIFTLFAFICTFPFYYIIINTISANNLANRGEILFWPKGIHFSNYIEVLGLPNIGRAALVSIARTVIGTAVSTLGASYMGYCFTKRNMWHYKLWYRFAIITMYFGAGLIPGYLNIKMLGLLNSFWVYIIPGMFPVYNAVLVKTYMESIPASLEESAEIDGAGYLYRFIVIMFPLSFPTVATIALFSAVGQWNSFMDTLLYINDYELYPLQFLLYQYFKEADKLMALVQSGQTITREDIERTITPNSVRLTVTVIITFPIMCVYPFIQRYFIRGIMIGAIKG